MKQMVFSCLCFLVCCAIVACRQQGADFPERVPASVKVLYRGSPLVGANVTLHPQSTDGKPAFGRTDAEGRAVLSTFGNEDGAMPGEYIATVVKKDSGQQAAGTPGTEEGAMPANPGAGAPPPPPPARDLLPNKYASPQTSGLRVTVPAEGLKDFVIELTD